MQGHLVFVIYLSTQTSDERTPHLQFAQLSSFDVVMGIQAFGFIVNICLSFCMELDSIQKRLYLGFAARIL